MDKKVMPPYEESNGWSKYEWHVLCELDRISSTQQEVLKQLNLFRAEIAVLKIKCGIFGIVGVLIAGIAFWIKDKVIKG